MQNNSRSDILLLLYFETLDLAFIPFSVTKGNQPWIFIWKIDAEAEAPIFQPPDVKSQLTGKDADAWKG